MNSKLWVQFFIFIFCFQLMHTNHKMPNKSNFSSKNFGCNCILCTHPNNAPTKLCNILNVIQRKFSRELLKVVFVVDVSLFCTVWFSLHFQFPVRKQPQKKTLLLLLTEHYGHFNGLLSLKIVYFGSTMEFFF